MANSTNFIDALMELKRKSKLMGRPASTREISAVSEGYFADASTRLARQKQLALQERELVQTKELSEKQLALQQDRLEAEKEAAIEARKTSQRQAVGTGAGMIAGAAIGSIVPGVGTAVGAMVGGAIGGITGGGCIIVSSCTSRYSYETDITRQVRDQYIDPITLSGYYALGNIIVPWIKKSLFIKKMVKKCLVDRLIDYGECLLGYKQKTKYRTSKIVTETFLDFCYGIGKAINLKKETI